MLQSLRSSQLCAGDGGRWTGPGNTKRTWSQRGGGGGGGLWPRRKGSPSFPVDSWPPLKLDLPAKTGPEDLHQKPAQTSKDGLGFE